MTIPGMEIELAGAEGSDTAAREGPHGSRFRLALGVAGGFGETAANGFIPVKVRHGGRLPVSGRANRAVRAGAAGSRLP